MVKIISQRIVKKGFFKFLKDNLITKELKKKALLFNKERQSPLAVFANDFIGTNVNLYGLFEREELEDLKHFLDKIEVNLVDSTVIDIGANIGNHAFFFSKYFKKVKCYEPNPRTFLVLQANSKYIKNIEVFNWGCGAKVETVFLKENFNNIGKSSVVQEINYDNKFQILIKPLDDQIETFRSVALIKIDVEGMEIDVLKGAEKTIERFLPVICFEQNTAEFLKGFNETETIQWLRKKNYRIFAIQNPKRLNYALRRLNNLKQFIFGITQKRQIIEFKNLPKGNYTMVFAVHSSIKI